MSGPTIEYRGVDVRRKRAKRPLWYVVLGLLTAAGLMFAALMLYVVKTWPVPS